MALHIQVIGIFFQKSLKATNSKIFDNVGENIQKQENI